MTRADIPGLGLAEVSGTRIDVSSYGYATAPDTCVTDDTIFEAASLTKPVVAYAVMRLADRGRLGLDDALVDLLPTLPLPADDARSARVTVRMALAHTTGLQGPDDRTLEFVRDPGQSFAYYPAGYRLVQRVVEHLEGDTLEAITRREVFEPLQMSSSSLVYRPEYGARLASRHRMLGDPIVRDRDPDVPANAAASLLTTAGDYGRFLRATLRGEGLSSQSWRAMLTPQIVVPETEGAVAWGLGWGLEPERGTFFHWGDDGSAKAFTIGTLSGERAIVSFANSYYGMAIAGEIAERVVPGTSPAVTWLGYGAWDDPKRIARLHTVRAFVDGDADLGMQAFERFVATEPDVDADDLAGFVQWILDGRGKHAGRAKVVAWQLARRPGDAGLAMELARSLRACGDDAGALDALDAALATAEGDLAVWIANRARWIRDEFARDDPGRGAPPVDAAALAGVYGERRITAEAGELWYQREGRPRFRLIWMCGTTYALEGTDSFRLRFELEDGTATRVVGLYEGGQTDVSGRSDGAGARVDS